MECQNRTGYIVQIDSFQEKDFIESLLNRYKGKTAEREIKSIIEFASIYSFIEKQSMLS